MKYGAIKQSVLEMTRAGKTPAQITEIIGSSVEYVYSIIGDARKAGELPIREKVNTRLLADIQRLKAEGVSHRKIATALGVSYGMIYYTITQARKEGLMPPAEPKAKKPKLTKAQELDLLYSPALTQEIRDLYARDRLTVSKLAVLFSMPEVEVRKIVNTLKVYGRPSDITLVRIREPKPKVEVTDELRAAVLLLRNREHYDATAISQQTGIDVGEVMDIIREDRLQELVLSS